MGKVTFEYKKKLENLITKNMLNILRQFTLLLNKVTTKQTSHDFNKDSRFKFNDNILKFNQNFTQTS